MYIMLPNTTLHVQPPLAHGEINQGTIVQQVLNQQKCKFTNAKGEPNANSLTQIQDLGKPQL